MSLFWAGELLIILCIILSFVIVKFVSYRMKKIKVRPTIITDYNSEEVDIFLKVKGRLPSKKGDCLFREDLDEFIFMFLSGELHKKGMFNPDFLYTLIADGKIKAPLKPLKKEQSDDKH